MMEILLERSGQEITIAEGFLREATKTKCALINMQSKKDFDNFTPIQKFYDDQNIFITGCPGIGRKSCFHVIYDKTKVYVREKILIIVPTFQLFFTLRKKQLTFQNRIVAIRGVRSLPNLGISMIDKVTLKHEVSIIFNVAATVRFTEKMKSVTAINVGSLNGWNKFVLKIPKLKVPTLSSVYVLMTIKIENVYGPVGITTNVLMGLMRTHHCDESIKVNLVPGELTINGIIISAWDMATNQRSRKNFPIYNYVSDDNPITYGKLVETILKYGELISSEAGATALK
ncbi:fatty acyl-CoA reductase wat-like [Vespula squamosa]|uniref:Fatty acyl-CoA reductase n=1 Tax=Vespula squamosa TaxID=30214 RepID=A0ABD2C959_VESSQ